MKGILKALIGLVVSIAAAALVWAVWRHESRSKAAQSPRSVEEPTVVVQRIEAARCAAHFLPADEQDPVEGGVIGERFHWMPSPVPFW